jgi:hypothetical protein
MPQVQIEKLLVLAGEGLPAGVGDVSRCAVLTRLRSRGGRAREALVSELRGEMLKL